MIEYELLSKEDGTLVYAFYPNGDREHPGIVAFHPGGRLEIIQESEEEVGGMFKGHAFSGIPRYGYKTKGLVAWY